MSVIDNKGAVKLAAALTLAPGAAAAHVAEQGFVLLLPTGAYTAAGVAVVALTVLALIAAPDRLVRGLFAAHPLRLPGTETLRLPLSLMSLAALGFLIFAGLEGSRDPLSNPMPLAFWTLFWVGLVSLAGLFGDLWRYLNPWTGLCMLLRGARAAPFRLPPRLGQWPAVAVLLGFAAFLLADVAPDDPARLAWLAGAYWLATMAGVLAFGDEEWRGCADPFTVIFAAYGALSPLRLSSRPAIGGPGWRLLESKATLAGGVFALVLLGVGSFDGINETFWWLARIGVNPLEFPGRSAVVAPTLAGLVLANLALIAAFAATVRVGLALAGAQVAFTTAFARLALSILPIALGYHIAHYFTAFLVGGQYAIAAISDPWASGADYLGIEPFYVTTGFFNHIEGVRPIWLTQAGAVVIGHVWSVLLAHRMALDLFGGGRRATLATLPLSFFMVAYTFLGLWLLAAPRGA